MNSSGWIFLALVSTCVSTWCNATIGGAQESCGLVGHQRQIKIPGCLDATVQINACSGFCESFSFPQVIGNSGGLRVVMRGSCCSIVETHDVEVKIKCFYPTNEDRIRVLKSASRCSCSECR